MKPFNARVVILTPGKPQPLCELPKLVKTVTIFALAANTGVIHVGGPGVRAAEGSANGYHLIGGSNHVGRPDALTLPPPGIPYEAIDLNDWWIDATVAGEGVSIVACL